jgi:hypothetical protein
MARRAALTLEGDVIRVTNSHGRTHAIVVAVSGVAFLVLPFVVPHLPAGLVDLPKGEEAWTLHLLAGFLCLSAAFWWSVVTLDPKADQFVIARRWGLCCTRRRRALSAYDSVTLRADSDEEVSVYLENDGSRDWSVETNHDMAIVWGRPYEDARAVAEILAAHLGFRLHDEVRGQ